MKYVNNIEDMQPDTCDRSLRFAVKNREKKTLRDTYFLIDPEESPSKNLKMGFTIVYAGGKTTGHSHPDHEEVYYVLQGKGRMEVGETQYEVNTGDALYVPFGLFHTTYNTGILPLHLLWVTGKGPEKESSEKKQRSN
ncbi:MAG: cupin domain-containing protein [Spirochaetota bacterium]